MTYGEEVEERLLTSAMVAREGETPFMNAGLKRLAVEIAGVSIPEFKGSDGWAKKFCVRNGLNVHDKFSLPRRIPRYVFGSWNRLGQ